MKLPRILLLISFMLSVHSLAAQPPDLVGTWQLIRQISCLEETTTAQPESVESLRSESVRSESVRNESLRNEMQSRSSASQQVVSFKSNSSGEESTRILNSSRVANAKKFLYKFNGEMLLILDKKSQTISASYVVDKFTSDSLILSNASRPCEVRILAKINERPAN